jgi:hypothetical protein
MGRPAISRRTLCVSRVEASRAGMTPAMRRLLIEPSLQSGGAGNIGLDLGTGSAGRG